MYHQINATQMFRERQLGLLEEADNRRLARRLRAVRSSGQEKGMGRLRKTVLLFVGAMAMVVLTSTVALAETRVGTDNPETLTGTNSADHITAEGGNDTLKGLARNDTYHFDNGWGQDTLTETAFVKVGKKKLPGGTDTLSFVGMSSLSGVTVNLIPQWVSFDPSHNQASDGGTNTVNLGTSPVENVVGSPAHDTITGGSASNTLSGGPGGDDYLRDMGGCSPTLAASCETALPASSDTYLGFTGSHSGTDFVWDYGGTADRLDLRPLRSSEVHFDTLNWDVIVGDESLKIVIDSTHVLFVIGHFAPFKGEMDDGRIEQIIFSDEVVTSGAELNSLM